ncbi:MAG: hypothetical protein HQK76_16405 [Desulfobacterales bacterium]|nr:hypothetical protein [Desulfobacterales bacterium]
MEWIYLKEASKLIGKSEKTLKRILLEIDQSNDKNMSNSILYKKEKANNGYTWFINKDSLLNYYNSKKMNKTKDVFQTDINESNVHLIDLLKQQITVKDNQINELNCTIKELTERIRELNNLLGWREQKLIEYENKQKKGLIGQALDLFFGK